MLEKKIKIKVIKFFTTSIKKEKKKKVITQFTTFNLKVLG